MSDDDTTRAPESEEAREGYVAVVLDKRGHEVLPLPDRGVLTIGRGSTSALRIDRPWISRAHARLYIGEEGSDGPTVEDLGSPNGVRVNGRALAAGERCRLRFGDVVLLGTTMLVVQARALGGAAMPALTRSELVARVEADCERAVRLGLAVEVVAVAASGEAEWDVRAAVAATHSLSVFAVQPGAPFLAATLGRRPKTRDASARLDRRIDELLRARGLRARVGSAVHPDDGTTAATLIEVATERALAQPVASASDDRPLHDAVSALERERVRTALESCGWNQSRAAKQLGIARNTLIARMKAYGLRAPED